VFRPSTVGRIIMLCKFLYNVYLPIGRFILNIAAQWMDPNSSLENIKVNL
jgi:hypothetical protein